MVPKYSGEIDKEVEYKGKSDCSQSLCPDGVSYECFLWGCAGKD